MKIALVLNDDFSMYHFRGGLIRKLVQNRFDVSVIVPPGSYSYKLSELGVRVICVKMERFFSPARDLRFFLKLFWIFQKDKFDIVHNMTIKPNIYGTFAAAAAGVRRRLCLVSGLGFMFSEHLEGNSGPFKLVTLGLYRVAMGLSHKTWFQNPDDLDFFVKKRIIRRDKGVVICSGGINVEDFSPSAVDTTEVEALRHNLNLPKSSKCVLMVAARMVWSKGVKEFINAVSWLHDRHPNWFFIMVCPRDSCSPDSVPKDYVEHNQLERLIVIDTFRYDIKAFIALADIVTLPSFYPEGVPRVLLEGLAMAKPIVTTDHRGCRETVEDGRNGYLIPIKNHELLAEKLSILMGDQSLRMNFGQESRRKAKTEFSESIVVDRIIREVYEISTS